MVKRFGYLILILVMVFSLSGCSKGKEADLTPEQRAQCEMLAKTPVFHEVATKYGLEPGITIDKLTAREIKGDVYNVYNKITFEASGSYTVTGEDGVMYSGTFKSSGYIEGHGSGWDDCTITPPRNGLVTLPEKPVEETSEIPAVTETESDMPTTEPEKYEPLMSFINENVTLAGTIIDPPSECDLNADGHPEFCTTVVTGSGVISSLIVVYDVYNDHGYMLDERMTYDYRILGCSEDEMAIERREFNGDGTAYGTVEIQNGELVFIENEAYGATLPVNT